MKSENESKEIDIKNCVCYYFDDIINGTKINFSNILLDKKFQLKMFQFIRFQIKLQQAQNHFVLGLTI